eukprot:scaffold59136_cov16-Tisochrysis_lutea.AAC.1
MKCVWDGWGLYYFVAVLRCFVIQWLLHQFQPPHHCAKPWRPFDFIGLKRKGCSGLVKRSVCVGRGFCGSQRLCLPGQGHAGGSHVRYPIAAGCTTIELGLGECRASFASWPHLILVAFLERLSAGACMTPQVHVSCITKWPFAHEPRPFIGYVARVTPGLQLLDGFLILWCPAELPCTQEGVWWGLSALMIGRCLGLLYRYNSPAGPVPPLALAEPNAASKFPGKLETSAEDRPIDIDSSSNSSNNNNNNNNNNRELGCCIAVPVCKGSFAEKLRNLQRNQSNV